MECVITTEVFKILNNILENNKKPKEYLGVVLMGSEINLLKNIHNYPEYNSKEFARSLNVTKGAITQTIKKLIAKGLISYYYKENNKKEKYYTLSTKGNEVYKLITKENLISNQNICNYFSSISKKDKELIKNFLNVLASNNFSDFKCLKGGNKC